MEVASGLRKYEEQKNLANSSEQKNDGRSPSKKDLPINALERFVDSRKTIDVLLKKGIKFFFPVQYETYNYIYDKRDIIAKDRTGSGKTLAFSLPIIERFRDRDLFGDRTTKFLVVLPTRELANQVKNQIASLRYSSHEFSVVPVYGGTHMGDQISEIRRGADIIVSTPGRLLDLLERGIIKLDNLRVVCLDEADEMLRQGFQEDIEKIFKYIKKHTDRKTQNLLFSATIPSWVLELSRTYLSEDRKVIDLIKSSDIKTSKTIEHLAIRCSSYRTRDAAISSVIDYYGGKDGRTIVFTETKKEANQIGYKANIGKSAEVLHGDIPQKKREYVFRNFKEGRIKCIIATNVAARGLDIPEVDLIVQLEPPKDVETYIHRAGRTGRAGKSGVCLTFYSDDQRRLISKIEYTAQIKIRDVRIPDERDERHEGAHHHVKPDPHHQRPEVRSHHHHEVRSHHDSRSHYDKVVSTVSTHSHHPSQSYLGFSATQINVPSNNSITAASQGYIGCVLRLPQDFTSMAPIFDFLKNFVDPRTFEEIRNMKKSGTNSAVFEVPHQRRDEMQRLSNLLKTETSPDKRYEVEIFDGSTTVKAPLVDPRQALRSNSEPLTDIAIREALRRRKELEVEIKGLSSSTKEQDLVEYLKEKKIQIVNIQLAKDDKGEFIGTAVVLCSDDRNLKQILRLSGSSIGDRPIKISEMNSY